MECLDQSGRLGHCLVAQASTCSGAGVGLGRLDLDTACTLPCCMADLGAPRRRLLGERRSPPYLESVDDLVGAETAGQKTSCPHGLLPLTQRKGRFALALGQRGKFRRGREGAQGFEPRLNLPQHQPSSLHLSQLVAPPSSIPLQRLHRAHHQLLLAKHLQQPAQAHHQQHLEQSRGR